MRSMLLGIVIGGFLTWGSLTHHVLRTDQGFTYVPKRSMTFADAYLDVRGWGVAQWTEHPDLMWTLAQNNRTDIVNQAGTIASSLKDALGVRK